MNTKNLSGAALKKALAAKLRELLEEISWLGAVPVQNSSVISDKGFDFLVKLPRPNGGKVELWVQCKADPRPSQFSYVFVASEARHPPVLVLAAPFISPRMAEVCKENGWSWFDLAGNFRLDVPGMLHLQHTGNEPVHSGQSSGPYRFGSKAGHLRFGNGRQFHRQPVSQFQNS